MVWFPSELDDLLAVASATFNHQGLLLAANAGFLQLVKLDKAALNDCYADQFFIQPDFATLLNSLPNAAGKVFSGLLIIGPYADKTHTLKARVWHENNTLYLLAEYDIQASEQLNDTVLALNQDYAKAQFDITQTNLKLKQRELELENTLTKLKATQKHLVEAEKMASLGVMVAGVAHEINSPLGVCIGSASLLAQQTQTLALGFAEKRMTQSDLNNFLSKALQETALMHSNLERIGRLTDRFRQLAVGNSGVTKSGFNLRKCLDDVITSLHSQLLDKQVDVQLLCDTHLEIVSFASDWTCIFNNLILNSVRHGFKGRQHGTIKIRITHEHKRLRVDYADDGIGLSQDSIARIFDPFFTTDLQQGMGVGMHMLYNIITQQMQGHIVCDSLLLNGAHFNIEIPL